MSAVVVIVGATPTARGSGPLAAAFAAAASDRSRAALWIDLAAQRRRRPTLLASAAARELEERLVSAMPGAEAGARGILCHLWVPGAEDPLASATAAIRAAGAAPCFLHLPARLWQPALNHSDIRIAAAVLRADFPGDLATAALAVADLRARGVRPFVAKQGPGALASRRALTGLSAGAGAGRATTRIGAALRKVYTISDIFQA